MRLQADPLACSEVDKHACLSAGRLTGLRNPKSIMNTKKWEGAQGRLVRVAALPKDHEYMVQIKLCCRQCHPLTDQTLSTAVENQSTWDRCLYFFSFFLSLFGKYHN